MKRILISALIAAAASAAASAEPGEASAPGAAPLAAPFAAAAPVSGSDLGRITGKADTAMEIRANNSATVSNNSVVGSDTGTINFDAQAFQGMAGLSLLSANTGNNVSINSSLNLNVAIQP